MHKILFFDRFSAILYYITLTRFGRKMLTKKLISVLFIIASLVFSACFTPWEGDGATLHINLGNPGRAAAWGEHVNFMSSLEHRISLDGPGGLINRTLRAGEMSAEFRLVPGRWTVTIEGYLFGIIYSSFTQTLNLGSVANSVSMPMAHSPPEGGILASAVFTATAPVDGRVRISGLSSANPPGLGSILNFPIIHDGNLVTEIGTGPLLDSVTQTALTNFNNTNVTHVSIPGSVVSITSRAFYGDNAAPSKITSLTLGYGLVNIGSEAFRGTTAANAPKIGRLVLPNSVVSVGNSAFDGTSLNSLILSESLETIGIDAFRGDHTFTSLVIPDSVKTLGLDAFRPLNADAGRLETLIIGNGLSVIAEGAFSNQRNLKNLTIGNNVTAIDIRAFQNHGLTSVVIPASVQFIYRDAFSQPDVDHSLEEVVFYTDGVSFSDAAFGELPGIRVAYVQGGAGIYRRDGGIWQRVGNAP